MKRAHGLAGLLVASAFGAGAVCSAAAAGTSATPNAVDPSLPPITIGFHNLEGGQFSLPDLRIGFEAAVQYVNDELGGIDGHRLDVVGCQVDMVPETSVNCANRFVDEQVVMAVQGIDYTFDAGLPILQDAGIIDVGAYAYGPLANAAQDDFFALNYSNEEGMSAALVMLDSLGATKVAELLINAPSMQTAASDVVVPTAEHLGMEITPVFYDQPADWATIAATVVAGNPDAVNLLATEPDCLAAIPALRSAGFSGPIVAGVCMQPLTELDPSVLEDVYIGSPYYTPQMADVPDDAREALEVFGAHVDLDEVDVYVAAQGWTTGLFAASILAQVDGDVTTESVREAAQSASGQVPLRPAPFDCAAPSWPGTTACGTGFLYGRATADGQIELLADQPIDIGSVIPSE